MALACLKCETRVDDEHTEPCPSCGSREWAWIDQPVKPYKITRNDKGFLRSIRVTPED